MRLLLVTDAWAPQVNGVVRTLETTVRELARVGVDVEVVHPGRFATLPCPFYPEIRLAWGPESRTISRLVDAADAVHIATEGPLGLCFRNFLVERGRAFTTAYHTSFPEYLARYCWLPEGLSYGYLRWFHGKARRLMVATPSLEARLRQRGFRVPIARWSRGVDTELFHPGAARPRRARPLALYVGRVSYEKNIDAFLSCPLDVDKHVVGDGPQRAALQQQFPGATFHGYRSGAALADLYRQADVFVFPSKTDTFGLVILEALACGVPVAAYPVTGPVDLLAGHPRAGCLHEDLGTAIREALQCGHAEACRALALRYSWPACARAFLANLASRIVASRRPHSTALRWRADSEAPAATALA
jgi:glycosyltransferase involved in cell wall biosynthesis